MTYWTDEQQYCLIQRFHGHFWQCTGIPLHKILLFHHLIYLFQGFLSLVSLLLVDLFLCQKGCHCESKKSYNKTHMSKNSHKTVKLRKLNRPYYTMLPVYTINKLFYELRKNIGTIMSTLNFERPVNIKYYLLV